MSELQSIAIAVVVRRGEVLIGQRPEHSVLGGYWEFPGGKLLPDESWQAAAERECWEETGLRVLAGRRLAVVDHEYDHGTLRLTFLVCELADDEVYAARAPFRWVNLGELPQYRFPPANEPVLALLANG